MTLRSKLIRLAQAHPELRADLLPLLKTARGEKTYMGKPAASWQVRQDYVTTWSADLVELIKAYWGPNLKHLNDRGHPKVKVTVQAVGFQGHLYEWALVLDEDTGLVTLQVKISGDTGASHSTGFLASASGKDIVEGMDLFAMKYLKARPRPRGETR